MKTGRFYAFGQWCGEFHERHEFAFAVVEMVIPLLAVLFHYEVFSYLFALPPSAFFSEASQQAIETGLRTAQERGEVFVLLLLVAVILIRGARFWRRLSLGVRFDSLAKQGGADLIRALAQKAMGGFIGKPVPNNEVEKAAGAIASMSASVFSLRTSGTPDARWKSAEEKYLQLWRGVSPAAIWRIPPAEGSSDPARGYFSVIVPIPRDSWDKVRCGDLATLLAAAESEPENAEDLLLLGYCVVFVADGGAISHEEQVQLLYAGVEHIAYLVQNYRKNGQKVRMICESANRSLRDTLIALHFEPVKFQSGHGKAHAARSPAGFQLFQYDFTWNDTDTNASEPKDLASLVTRIVAQDKAAKKKAADAETSAAIKSLAAKAPIPAPPAGG